MSLKNNTAEFIKLRFTHELDVAVLQNTALIERNYYTLIESTLDLIFDYNEQKEFRYDDENYSDLKKRIHNNSMNVVSWEKADRTKTQKNFITGVIMDLNIFQRQHHCRLCGGIITQYKEYDFYYLSLLIEQEYLKNLNKYEEYKVLILKYWFIKFKVCLDCNYNIIMKKDRKMYQDMIIKKGGFDEQSGESLDWILSKMDYYNNLHNVITFLLKSSKKEDSNMKKLTDYLLILEEDILHKSKIKLQLLNAEKNRSEITTVCTKLLENLIKKVNFFLLDEVKPNMPKEDTPNEVKSEEIEKNKKKDDKTDDIRNRIIIYEEQRLLLNQQYESFKIKRQFKDCKEIKRNIEMLEDEIKILESEIS
ncbi:uncharacterized protein HGUI_02869 [Hanseniaspora guilliermondii]|uniref:Uncharacterized protein n=1 Tax=Hanseniaspora guilliermondii TaxID=56406 RepID=A0A1L0CP24_9ASCO|nr:uncharacterized protein HGUI_02869 [Hanseniaspora guilliermondii]